MIKLLMRLIIFLIITTILVGCSDQSRLRKLQEELQQIKINAAKDQRKIELSQNQLPQPVTFPPNAPSSSARRAASTSQNPLENYPLKSLRFAGTLTENNQTAAFIMTPDNMIYQVKVGEMLGNESGRIVKIFKDRVDVNVQLAQPGKPITNETVTLQLKE